MAPMRRLRMSKTAEARLRRSAVHARAMATGSRLAPAATPAMTIHVQRRDCEQATVMRKANPIRSTASHMVMPVASPGAKMAATAASVAIA